MRGRALVVPTVAAVWGLLGVGLQAVTWGEQTTQPAGVQQVDPCATGCLVWTGETAIDGVTPGWLLGASS